MYRTNKISFIINKVEKIIAVVLYLLPAFSTLNSHIITFLINTFNHFPLGFFQQLTEGSFCCLRVDSVFINISLVGCCFLLFYSMDQFPDFITYLAGGEPPTSCEAVPFFGLTCS